MTELTKTNGTITGIATIDIPELQTGHKYNINNSKKNDKLEKGKQFS